MCYNVIVKLFYKKYKFGDELGFKKFNFWKMIRALTKKKITFFFQPKFILTMLTITIACSTPTYFVLVIFLSIPSSISLYYILVKIFVANLYVKLGRVEQKGSDRSSSRKARGLGYVRRERTYFERPQADWERQA